jgi:hypothetical protein
MKRTRTVETVTTSLDDYKTMIHSWYRRSTHGQTLYCYFSSKDFIGGCWDIIEEIQMNIRKRYPPDVLISFKQSSIHPANFSIPIWNEDFLKEMDGYWYLVAHRLE